MCQSCFLYSFIKIKSENISKIKIGQISQNIQYCMERNQGRIALWNKIYYNGGKCMKEKKRKKFSQNSVLNREYKDSLFRLIFSEKKDLLDLYNALNGTSYSNPEDLEVNTLKDAVYISIKNDISFLIGGTLNLYEHQSTYNPNLPIRGLIYLAHLYEGYVESGQINLYSSGLKKLPFPRYFVFYNGTKKAPDCSVLKLSDAFQKPGKDVEPCLECQVILLNINYGHNQELMEKCRRLGEYSQFVLIVREQKKVCEDPEKATLQAIDLCIKQGVLVDILRKHRAEVISMVLSSFNQEAYEEDVYEMGYKDGEQRINTLYENLLKEHRIEEMKQAMADEEHREALMKEYGL